MEHAKQHISDLNFAQAIELLSSVLEVSLIFKTLHYYFAFINYVISQQQYKEKKTYLLFNEIELKNVSLLLVLISVPFLHFLC